MSDSTLGRPDDGDRIDAILAAGARQCGFNSAGVDPVTREECAEWRARHAAGESIASIDRDVDRHYSTISDHVHGNERCHHGDERGADPGPDGHRSGKGVHAVTDDDIAAVAAALRERLEANPGDATYFRAPRLVREHDLGLCGQRATAALRELAREERDDVVVERSNPDANQARWTAREGGES